MLWRGRFHGREMMEAVRAIRNMRAEMNVPAGKKATIIIRTDKADVVNATCEYMKKTGYGGKGGDNCRKVRHLQTQRPSLYRWARCSLPLGDLVDKEKELARLTKECEKLAGEIKRAPKVSWAMRNLQVKRRRTWLTRRAKLEKYRDVRKG